MSEDDETPEEVVNGHAPKVNRRGFDCPHCGAFAQQDWFSLLEGDGKDSWPLTEGEAIQLFGVTFSEQQLPVHFKTSRCFACSRLAIWRGAQMVWPATTVIPPASPDTPADVRELYDEGRAAWAVSRRAGAALARASLERLLRQDPSAKSGATLDALIGDAVKTVSVTLGKLLDVVRHAGNASLHVKAQPDDAMALLLDETNAEIGPLIFDAINMLIDERITKVAQVGALLDSMPPNVLDGINKRSGKQSL